MIERKKSSLMLSVICCSFLINSFLGSLTLIPIFSGSQADKSGLYLLLITVLILVIGTLFQQKQFKKIKSVSLLLFEIFSLPVPVYFLLRFLLQEN